MSAREPVLIARCPQHGLHGERSECFVCGSPVEQVPVVPLAAAGRATVAAAREDRRWSPSDIVSPFFVRCADALYATCERAIREGRIDARSPIGDATLDYRDERNDMATACPRRLADRQAADEALRGAAQAVFDAVGNGEDELADALVALGLALAAVWEVC